MVPPAPSPSRNSRRSFARFQAIQACRTPGCHPPATRALGCCARCRACALILDHAFDCKHPLDDGWPYPWTVRAFVSGGRLETSGRYGRGADLAQLAAQHGLLEPGNGYEMLCRFGPHSSVQGAWFAVSRSAVAIREFVACSPRCNS